MEINIVSYLITDKDNTNEISIESLEKVLVIKYNKTLEERFQNAPEMENSMGIVVMQYDETIFFRELVILNVFWENILDMILDFYNSKKGVLNLTQHSLSMIIWEHSDGTLVFKKYMNDSSKTEQYFLPKEEFINSLLNAAQEFCTVSYLFSWEDFTSIYRKVKALKRKSRFHQEFDIKSYVKIDNDFSSIESWETLDLYLENYFIVLDDDESLCARVNMIDLKYGSVIIKHRNNLLITYSDYTEILPFWGNLISMCKTYAETGEGKAYFPESSTYLQVKKANNDMLFFEKHIQLKDGEIIHEIYELPSRRFINELLGAGLFFYKTVQECFSNEFQYRNCDYYLNMATDLKSQFDYNNNAH